jgi:kinesin family protein 3/17
MNDVSSRSHAVFIIIVEQMTMEEDEEKSKYIKVGKLNLVDLAGSERVRVTGATGQRLEECKKIN